MAYRWMSVLLLSAACGGSKTTTQSPARDPSAGGTEQQASCEPGRCLDDISAAIAERRPDARRCYEEGLKRTPGIQGKIIINFAIDSEGVVGETSQGMQDDQITEQGVIDCVSEVIKTVRFAKSAKGKTTRAYHRFEFSP